MTHTAETKKLAQEVVNKWHANPRNFEREMQRGTPKWLALARLVAKG